MGWPWVGSGDWLGVGRWGWRVARDVIGLVLDVLQFLMRDDSKRVSLMPILSLCRFSYDCFSHKKSVMVKKLAMEPSLFVRYPPYSDKKMSMAKMLLEKSLKSSWCFSVLCLVTSISVVALAAFAF